MLTNAQFSLLYPWLIYFLPTFRLPLSLKFKILDAHEIDRFFNFVLP